MIGVFRLIKNAFKYRIKKLFMLLGINSKDSVDIFLDNVILETENDDLIIDVGANKGDFLKRFIPTGCELIAFEPNPICAPILKELSESNPNIRFIPAAASVKAGSSRLYLHENSKDNELFWSEAASLYQGKSNIDVKNYTNIETIDFADFILSLDKPITLLKVDIEGHEVELLPHLLKRGCLAKVKRVLVETHEKKNPELSESTKIMKELFEEYNYNRVNWEWH